MKKLYKLLVLCLLVFLGGGALKAQDVVAKVGDTEYSDFSAAISNWNDGTTLTLLADVERTSSITISNKSYNSTHIITSKKFFIIEYEIEIKKYFYISFLLKFIMIMAKFQISKLLQTSRI